MACRVLIGSEGVRVSKPGIDVYNWGAEQNLLINMGSRVGQIIAHGGFPLSIDSDRVATGRADIGPFTETPDIMWQVLYGDAQVRFPPAVWQPTLSNFALTTDGTVSVSRSGISARFTYVAGDPLPAWLIYQIMRKAQV